MRLLGVLLAIATLSPTRGQSQFADRYVEREFGGSCEQVEKGARTYLKTRGFTENECPKCASSNSLLAPGTLLDDDGKVVGTLRMRGELTDFKPPFWIWSSPLHGRIFLSIKATPSGCRLGFHIDFGSFHTMVVGLIPAGEKLGTLSNGRLESEYLDAIRAQLKP